jgi:hypothetical protein
MSASSEFSPRLDLVAYISHQIEARRRKRAILLGRFRKVVQWATKSREGRPRDGLLTMQPQHYFTGLLLAANCSPRTRPSPAITQRNDFRKPWPPFFTASNSPVVLSRFGPSLFAPSPSSLTESATLPPSIISSLILGLEQATEKGPETSATRLKRPKLRCTTRKRKTPI